MTIGVDGVWGMEMSTNRMSEDVVERSTEHEQPDR